MTMMMKLKNKLRMEEEVGILETEEEKLSKHKRRQEIKVKEDTWKIFPSATN